jgi:hypothetical protein
MKFNYPILLFVLVALAAAVCDLLRRNKNLDI